MKAVERERTPKFMADAGFLYH